MYGILNNYRFWTFVLILSIVGYELHPRSNVVVERYENGLLYRETETKDGLKNGFAKEYALNGRLIILGHFSKGKRDGVQLGWYSEGPKRFEYHFKDGFLDGTQIQWHLSGKVFRRDEFANGVQTDKQIFFSDGKTFTNYSKREGRIYGLDGGSLCMETKRPGEK